MNREEKIEKLQIEKLELELKMMRRPSYKTSTFWISVIGVILALVGVIAQGYLTNIDAANAKAEMREAQKIKKKAENEIQKLEKVKKKYIDEIDYFEKRSAALRESISDLASLSKSVATSTEVEQQVEKAENARFSIGVYGFEVKESIYYKVRKSIAEKGYTVNRGSLLTNRPTWLAFNPTVFYYHKDSKQLALNFAKDLRNLTGSKFKVQFVSSNNSLGVLKGEERWTFFIHLVGSK